MAAKKRVPAGEVRTWAEGKGLIEAGKVGKLSQDTIDAFHKSNKNKEYVPAKFVKTVQVKATRTLDNGKKVPVQKNINLMEARAAIRAAGIDVGARGRIPEKYLRAFAGDYLATVVQEMNATPVAAIAETTTEVAA